MNDDRLHTPSLLIDHNRFERNVARMNAQIERLGVPEALRAGGFEAPVVSVGSTPTAMFAEDLAGVSEVRAGVYAFMDLVMVGIGVCDLDDIAVSVLTEVIGHRADEGEVIVDAGWMALSRDRGTADQAIDHGYGVVCDEAGRVLEPEVIVRATNQEHGILARRDGERLDLDAFLIGRRLRVLPNHACATAGQFDKMWLVASDGAAVECLERCRGW